jgi:hypothetical protein
VTVQAVLDEALRAAPTTAGDLATICAIAEAMTKVR